MKKVFSLVVAAVSALYFSGCTGKQMVNKTTPPAKIYKSANVVCKGDDPEVASYVQSRANQFLSKKGYLGTDLLVDCNVKVVKKGNRFLRIVALGITGHTVIEANMNVKANGKTIGSFDATGRRNWSLWFGGSSQTASDIVAKISYANIANNYIKGAEKVSDEE